MNERVTVKKRSVQKERSERMVYRRNEKMEKYESGRDGSMLEEFS